MPSPCRPPPPVSAALRIPSLEIAGFRGIRALALPALGRATLLAGVNGIGKTTVLDAIRCYASRGDPRVLGDLIAMRDELVPGGDGDDAAPPVPDFASLFHDLAAPADDDPPLARIRSASDSNALTLRLADAGSDPAAVDALSDWAQPPDLVVQVGERSRRIPGHSSAYYGPFRNAVADRRRRTYRVADSWPAPIRVESLGPGRPRNADVARLWDAVVLADAEELPIRALRLVAGEQLERLSIVGEPHGRGRRAVAKLRSAPAPVPLRRLGDGANRLLAIAAALANCRDGILLLDEVENGIHYSIQRDLWRMIFDASAAANVQVVAATHSWDCIAGFAAAAVESPESGILYRLEQGDHGMEAIRYSEDNLQVAARQRTEVR